MNADTLSMLSLVASGVSVMPVTAFDVVGAGAGGCLPVNVGSPNEPLTLVNVRCRAGSALLASPSADYRRCACAVHYGTWNHPGRSSRLSASSSMTGIGSVG